MAIRCHNVGEFIWHRFIRTMEFSTLLFHIMELENVEVLKLKVLKLLNLLLDYHKLFKYKYLEDLLKVMLNYCLLSLLTTL